MSYEYIAKKPAVRIAWDRLHIGADAFAGFGQKSKDKAGYDRAARATVLHSANVYVTADADAQKISLVTPGHEVVVIERTGPWVSVFANTDAQDDINDNDKPEFSSDDTVTPASGWIRDKGIIAPATPGGDIILYRCGRQCGGTRHRSRTLPKAQRRGASAVSAASSSTTRTLRWQRGGVAIRRRALAARQG